MWKFIFYNKWELSKLENKLQDYESLGYRVDLVLFKHFFRLVPNDGNEEVQYFVLPMDGRGNPPELDHAYGNLLVGYHGQKIDSPFDSGWFWWNLFRVKGRIAEQESYILIRNRAMIKQSVQKIGLVGLYLIIFPMIIVITDVLYHPITLRTYIAAFVVLVGIIGLIFHVYQLAQLKKLKNNKED